MDALKKMFLVLFGLAACSSVLLYAADNGSGGVPYRRYLDAACMNSRGAFVVVQDDKGQRFMDGSFPTPESTQQDKGLDQSLELTLPPGKYLLWVSVTHVERVRPLPNVTTKAQEEMALVAELEDDKEIDADSVIIELGLGKNRERLVFSRSASEYSGGVIIDAKVPFRDVSLRVLSVEPRIRIRQLYVSACPGDMVRLANGTGVLSRHQIVEQLRGDPRQRQPEDRGNLLVNGSFEVGFGSYNWCKAYQSRGTIGPHSWATNTAAEGACSLRFPLEGHRYVAGVRPSAEIRHSTLRLDPNTRYHFLGMFRANCRASVTVGVFPAYPTGEEEPASVGSGSVSLLEAWSPLRFSFKTGDDGRGHWLTVSASAERTTGQMDQPPYVWMDGLVLSTKEPAMFTPSGPVEVGVTWTVPGKVFYRGEPEGFTLLARNYAMKDTAAEVDLVCRVVDYFDRTVMERPMRGWVVPAGQLARKVLPVGELASGAYRLLLSGEASIAGAKAILPQQEYCFCVLERPPRDMHRTLGAYINISPEPMAIMSRAGIRRTSTLSCANEKLSCWRIIEPARGEFLWWDDGVAIAASNDVEIIANIELQDAPAWALDPADEADRIRYGGEGRKGKSGSFSRTAMESFVEALVSHYKERVHTWFFLDEPYHYFSMDEYFKIVKGASAAARRADPNCRILSHCAYYPKNLPRLEELGIADYIDGVSGYARDPAQGKKLMDFAARNKKFINTVEYSWQVSMLQTIETPEGWVNSSGRTPMTYRENCSYLAIIPVAYMARAAAVAFSRYDARYPGGDFTQIDNYKCMFEYDGSLKPSAVAYAVAARLIDGCRGAGQPTDLHTDMDGFLLEDDTRFVLAFRLRGSSAVRALITLPSGVEGWDIMGRPLRTAPKPALLGADISYLIGPKARMDSTRQALAALSLTGALAATGRTTIDPASGQYIHTVTVKNNLPDEDVDVLLSFAGPVRTQGDRTRTLSRIRPGGSAETVYGLNAYRGDRVAPLAASYQVLVKAYESSAFIVVPVKNVYEGAL